MRVASFRIFCVVLIAACMTCVACDNNGSKTGGGTSASSTTSEGAEAPTVSADPDSVSDPSTIPTIDFVPDPFSFVDVLHAAICKIYVSNAIKVSGITSPSPISINQNGTDAQYRIVGSGSWRSGPGYVHYGEFVELKMTASCEDGVTRSCILIIGGVSDTWSVITPP